MTMIFWDPDSIFFIIPWIDWPIAWYGVLFALGFLLGYFIFRSICVKNLPEYSFKEVSELCDRLLWCVVTGAVVGARLGHLILYEKTFTFWDIFKIREGGLASHGGGVGVIIAIVLCWLFSRKKYPTLPLLKFMDYMAAPTALIAMFVRLGNFVNQEILGRPTDMPWGIIFGSPRDGSLSIPCHPVQLYEAFLYLLVFIGLYYLSQKRLRSGISSALFFLSVFSGRFILEFFKSKQSALLNDDSFLLMGQFLSIPFIVAGTALLLWRIYGNDKSRL
jgi:phosphatidylglycerol---prolipoprotein diacylglyceryl transferase